MMNRARINAFLVRNVLRDVLHRTNTVAGHDGQVTCKRFYRFGRRVLQNGYYVSPKWFDQELLKDDGKFSQSILRHDGVISKANRIFNEERDRQKSLVNRIEKIEIQLEKPFPKGQDYTLMMNRNISTPYDCATHIHEMLKSRSALAVVDGTQLWHMHQPLEKSCHLKLLHFKHPNTMPVNFAFWRSCSMLLASVVKKAFKEQFSVQIMSQPMSDLKGGSFVCDAVISNLDNWSPTLEELRSFTSMLWEETNKNQFFERITVNAEIAAKLFSCDPKRLALIENSNKDSFVAYRVGDHIDLCEEPMISSTGQIGSIFLSAIHRLKATNGGQFYRFQGVALPKQLNINAYAFSLIRDRAQQLNQIGLN